MPRELLTQLFAKSQIKSTRTRVNRSAGYSKIAVKKLPEFTLLECKDNLFHLAVNGFIYDLKEHPSVNARKERWENGVTSRFMTEISHNGLAMNLMEDHLIGTLRKEEFILLEELKEFNMWNQCTTRWCLQCARILDHRSCEKTPELVLMQNILLYQIWGISQYCHRLINADFELPSRMNLYAWIAEKSMCTVTNVDVLRNNFSEYFREAAKLSESLKQTLISAGLQEDHQKNDARSYQNHEDGTGMLDHECNIKVHGIPIRSLMQTGLSGTFAYMDLALEVQAVAKADGVQLWIPLEVWDSTFAHSFHLLNTADTE